MTIEHKTFPEGRTCPFCKTDNADNNRLEEHHFGELTSSKKTYQEAPRVLLCQKCHSIETNWFVKYKLPYHLSVPEMRGMSMHGEKVYSEAIKKKWKQFDLTRFM